MADIYITKDELRNAPYNLLVDEIDNIHLGVLQDLTKEVIDKLCGLNFEKEGETGSEVEKLLSGTGKDTIFLPKTILTLKEVRIYTSSNVYDTYEDSEFVVKNKYISWYEYTDAASDARIETGTFPEGSYNIGVVGIWGFSVYPEAIKYLQGRFIQKILRDESFTEKMKTEKIGNWSGSLLLNEKGDNPTGDFELDLIIRNYREQITYGIV